MQLFFIFSFGSVLFSDTQPKLVSHKDHTSSVNHLQPPLQLDIAAQQVFCYGSLLSCTLERSFFDLQLFVLELLATA